MQGIRLSATALAVGLAGLLAVCGSYTQTTSGNSSAVQREAQQVAQVGAVENLTGEVEVMLRDLRLGLAERRLGEGAR